MIAGLDPSPNLRASFRLLYKYSVTEYFSQLFFMVLCGLYLTRFLTTILTHTYPYSLKYEPTRARVRIAHEMRFFKSRFSHIHCYTAKPATKLGSH